MGLVLPVDATQPDLWPPGGQTATHSDTLRHTRPRENVVFSTRGVGSSPTSGSSKPASRAGFRIPTSIGGQRNWSTEGGPGAHTGVGGEEYSESHTFGNALPFPCADLECQIPARPAKGPALLGASRSAPATSSVSSVQRAATLRPAEPSGATRTVWSRCPEAGLGPSSVRRASRWARHRRCASR